MLSIPTAFSIAPPIFREYRVLAKLHVGTRGDFYSYSPFSSRNRPDMKSPFQTDP
jgi:hypothetical protein